MVGAYPGRVVDYQQLFLDHLHVIDRVVQYVARRHHLPPADAEDLLSLVRLRFVEDDYAILRKFQGRSRLETYLTVVVERLFLDQRVAEWGKWHPSAAAKRLGAAAVALERLMVREGLTFDEAVGTMQNTLGSGHTRESLDALLRQLPGRSVRRFAGEDELTLVAASGLPVDLALETEDDQRLADRVTGTLERVMAGLTRQDQLVLKLRFVDGVSIAQAARVLGVEQKALYRRLDQVHREVRAAVEADGIDPASIDRIVGHPLVALGAILGIEPPETA